MATIKGTQGYFQRLSDKNIPDHAVRTFGTTGWQVACIGFGGYRIQHNSMEHAKALRYALLNGFNLVDTSSNYGDGGSEMLIGNLLQEMLEREEISRDEVVVVSKGGYIQGQNLEIAKQHEADGSPFPEVVKYADDCWHCMHPEFLEEQLGLTLERLQLTAIDVYLLHNPEYFLLDSRKDNGPMLAQKHTEYYRRIKGALAWMEEKVSEGKIGAYGISSNTFVRPAEDAEFTSLEQVLQIADTISTDHYFKVIQFPLNLFESGAATEKNQSDGSMTVLQLAQKHNLAVLVNRPLNAMYGSGVVRLASFRETEPKAITEVFHKKMTTLQRLEKQYRDEFISKLNVDIPKETLLKLFALSSQLNNAFSGFQDWEHWDHVLKNLIFPQTMNSLTYLSRGLEDDEAWRSWAGKYAEAAVDFFDAISRKYENQAQERSLKLSGKLKNLSGDLATSDTLSQQSLRILTSTPAVGCVLLGMRTVPYVEDAIAAMKSEPIADAIDVLLELSQE